MWLNKYALQHFLLQMDVIGRQGFFVTPANTLSRPTNRVRLDSCLVRHVTFEILDSDQEINDEDYLLVVPTGRET